MTDQRLMRMPGDTRPPTEADRLARWADELGIRLQVYVRNGGRTTLSFSPRANYSYAVLDALTEHVDIDEGEDWADVAQSYLEGEAERQAEARALALGGLI